jgi:hypothetical protein
MTIEFPLGDPFLSRPGEFRESPSLYPLQTVLSVHSSAFESIMVLNSSTYLPYSVPASKIKDSYRIIYIFQPQELNKKKGLGM